MWRKCKRIGLRLYRWALVLSAVGVLLVLLVLGPWPVLPSAARGARARKAAVRLIERAGEGAGLAPAPFRAGDAVRRVVLDSGLPLAGHPARGRSPSGGATQQLRVRALAIDNGQARVLVFGADLLFASEALADRVRAAVKRRTALLDHQILFTATHTHSAPCPPAPWLLARLVGATRDTAFAQRLVSAHVQAGVEAVETLRPALFVSFQADAAELVVGEGEADARLRGFAVQYLDGGRAAVLNFGARANVLGPANLRVSGDYPGYAQEAFERRTGAMTIFQAGAVQGVAPRPPRRPDAAEFGLPALSRRERAAHARAWALGEELARRAEAALAGVPAVEAIALGSVRIRVPLPPMQARIDERWRLSPVLPWLAGIRGQASLQAVRIGDVVLVGLPFEFGGGLLRDLVRERPPGVPHLWICSLAGGCQGAAGTGTADALLPWLEPRDPEFFRAVVPALRRALADR